MKIFTNVIASPVRAKQSIFGLSFSKRESILLAMALVFAVFTACDSGSSSNDPDPIAEVSSSSDDIRQCEELSEGCDDTNSSSGEVSKNSSSSQKIADKDKSSSSIEEKSSSSVSGKNSSSSVAESSSSFELEPVCDDGDTTTVEAFGEYIYETCRDGFWEADSTKSKRVVDSLAAIEKNKEHPNMDSLFAGYDGEYLEFEDPRDGHKYKYIEFHGYTDDVGSHATFYVMAENLNYGKMVPRGTTKFDDNVTEKLCYEDDEWFCDNHFGGLYTWAEAMNLPKVCDSVAVDSNDACKAITEKRESYPGEEYLNIIWQGICPDGWHIMNQREWRYTRGDIRSKILWEENAGRNSDGLAIIPTARLQTDVYTALWMPSALESNVAKAVYFYSTSNNADLSGKEITRRTFRSIRCVMDEDNPLAKN